MEAQSLIVTARHRVALQIVDRARRGQESRTATALPERSGVRRSGGSNVSCSHAAGCPLFPYLGRACEVGANITATATIGGSTVRATRCHSPASACQSACCPTEPARDTSKTSPRRTGPAPPTQGRYPGRPRHHSPIRGHRRPRPGPSQRRPTHMSSQKPEP